MKFKVGIAVAILTASFASLASTVDTDSLTKLPLPSADGAFGIGRNPMKLNVPVCKSTAQMNFYTGASGKVDAAVAWYGSHLAGFKHTHGYGSGRSQDTYYNATGTLMVSITGIPAQEGENTRVYSVIYSAIMPGVSERAIVGMNIQKVVCP
jgi:hypothetical protein